MSALRTTALPVTAERGSATWRLIKAESTLCVRDKVGPLWGIGFPLLLLIILGRVPDLREPVEAGGSLTYFDLYVPVLIAVQSGHPGRSPPCRPRSPDTGRTACCGACEPRRSARPACSPPSSWPTSPSRSSRWSCSSRWPGSASASTCPKHLLGFALAWLLARPRCSRSACSSPRSRRDARAATAIGTVLFFPLMFFAGLWVPIAQMPPLLRDIAHSTPLGAGMGAFQDAYLGHFPSAVPLSTLAAYAVVCTFVAVRWFRWE